MLSVYVMHEVLLVFESLLLCMPTVFHACMYVLKIHFKIKCRYSAHYNYTTETIRDMFE